MANTTGLVGDERPGAVTERGKQQVHRSCKNIDIRNAQTILPWVSECIERHMSRYDFKHLLLEWGLPKEDYELACSGEKYRLNLVERKLAEEAVRRIDSRDLMLPPVNIEEKTDVSTGKTRYIGKESPWNQIFDYIAVKSTEDIWNRRIVPQQASSIKGRGQTYGTGLISKWLRSDDHAAKYAANRGIRYMRKCRYNVKLDVSQCYQSMRRGVFMGKFERDCGNEDLIWLWGDILSRHRVRMSSGKMNEGFMIGALPSQTAAQYILSFIYRYAMNLHRERRGKNIKLISHTLMWMDDIYLFSPSRRNLKMAVREIIGYAKREFGLSIKATWQIQETKDAPADMMGFLIHSDGNITVRPRVFVRVRRLALRIRRRQHISLRQAYRACSYKGYFIAKQRRYRAFAHGLKFKKVRRKYGLSGLFRMAAEVISKHDRRLNHDNGIIRRAGEDPVYAIA